MYSDNLIGYKYSSHMIRTHCKVFPIVLIYFYTRNTFLLSFWSSRQFNFSQCTSYIKGNQFGKTADEINDHLIRSIVEIKSELTTCKINHLSATIESGHLHEIPSLPANLEVICISRYSVQIQTFFEQK